MKRLLLAPLLLALSSPAQAEQFGLTMGESLRSIRWNKGIILTQQNDAPEQWFTEKLPKGTPDFYGYFLEVTPKAGLCKITAMKAPIETNSFGTQLITMFDYFEKELSKKYGPSKKYEGILPESKYVSPKDWMKGLAAQDRVLSAYWLKENNPKLKSDMDNIMLRAVGGDENEGALAFVYSYNNWNECQQEMGISSSKGL